MSYQSELSRYITKLQKRLRLGAWLRGAAIFAGTALIVTVLLVLLLNRFAFPAQGVTAARLTIFVALAVAAVFGIAVPLIRVTRRWAVENAEAANPAFQQRLTTFEERVNTGDDPFLELLAADTLLRTRDRQPSWLVPDHRLLALGGAGLATLAVLLWIVVAGPGYLGYGASLLWTKPDAIPLYAISVTPGNVIVRRNSDQLVTAQVTRLRPGKAQLFARYESSKVWEPAAMQAAPDTGSGANFQFVFAGLPEDVEYYVIAGPLVSSHFKVRVMDLPSIKDIRVTYHYPAWTGMKPVTERNSGDLRAIEGTDAAVEIKTDRPLNDGQLSLDNGQVISLAGGADNTYTGSIRLEKDGAYHLAQTGEGQQVRLSEDYFIATDKALPPEISIDRPGGDYRASPIEEVTMGVKAADPFGLHELHLHYSVNGGPNQDVDLLKTSGVKSVDGSYTLPLEDYALVPGDVVSLYATARDGHSEARTDIAFIQIEPFEREFSQSQQNGGGSGGGANNQTEISKREKELIAATWKQQNDKAATPKEAAAAGQFLSGAQQKLRDQVAALSIRMQSRDISEANEEFTDFDRDMQAAVEAMAPSAEKLKDMKWKDAIPLEQKVLQALLRAEATFRKIEVAFGQQGGAGAGGGNAGRDLASLFDLELDTEKNQYETAQTTSPAKQHEKDVADALEKLDALAKRQEDLANQQHNPQQSFEERWQQEMLRREAEQLERQLEQLARNGQQGLKAAEQDLQPQSSSSQNGARSSRQQSANPSAGSRTGASGDQRIEQALRRLQQATDDMKRNGNPQQNVSGQGAADQLRKASDLLAGTQQQLASDKLSAFSREVDRLTREEHEQADRIKKFVPQQPDPNATSPGQLPGRLEDRARLAKDRQQLSDDLSNFERNIREAAREMASTEPGVSRKLRDALTQMDESDLDNRVQRTADWLRRGINPNANGAESEIAQGLAKLDQQLEQAEQKLGQDGRAQKGRDNKDSGTSALDQVESLRRELEAMASAENGQRNGQQGQNRAGQSGDARSGGGHNSDGTAWNNTNTGNNRYGQSEQPTAPRDTSGNPVDTERTFRESMRALNQLRQTVRDDPEASKEVAELARQMQLLDPSRFPGNPVMLEQMHREVLGSVDRLELQLQRDAASTQARTGKSSAIPEGYQESVAEYYKRLSKNP
ncbi:MAG: hypothetical protein WAK20_19680 [Candidatus Acidiferrum sp.]